MSLINLNQINIVDATSTVALEGSIIVARQFDDNLWSSNYDGASLLPRGGPTARDVAIPLPVDGYIHYNTNSLEFEGYTNGDWRPITQLTRDGTALIPSRSFITDTDTGSFLSDVDTYGIAAGGVQQITVSSPINLRITSPDDGTGTIHWSDMSADRAFIRYNHLTEKFEFSGDGTNVAISIDGTTNLLTVLSESIFNAPVTFNDTVNLGPSGSFSSPGDIIFIIDNDDTDPQPGVDTTSVFKVQRHVGEIDTGFQVTQRGTVQAGDGLESEPSFNFASSTNTGWYFDTDPIDALTASFDGADKIVMTAPITAFLTPIRIPDGNVLLPGISFVDDPPSVAPTGFYQDIDDTISVGVIGVERFRFSADDTRVLNELVAKSTFVSEASQFLGATGSPTENIELLPTATVTLTDNTTATAFSYDATVYDAVIVDYLVQRTDGSAIGTLYIVTDGTLVTLTDANRTEVGAPGVGVSFAVSIALGNVEVDYTLTSTGNDATLRYGLRRWGV